MFELVLINKYIIKVVLSYYEYIIYIISLHVFRNISANLLLTALAMLLLVLCLLVLHM